MESQQKDIAKGSSNIYNLVLRVLAIAATVTAAMVMGIAKETKTISIPIVPTLPPMQVAVPAKYSYSSAFVYFFVANAIVSFYSLVSLILSMSTKSQKTKLALLISIADIAALALLFSGFGAAAAIGVVGKRGVSKVGWKKVCDVYTKFCAKVMVSVAISFVACVAYVALLLLALVGLHKRGR